MRRINLIEIVNAIVEDSQTNLSTLKRGREINPETGIKTKVSAVNKDTGKITWDVDYTADPRWVYDKLAKIIHYLNKEDPNSELGKMREALKSVKRRVARLF